MLLITPDPKDIAITEENVWVITDANPTEIEIEEGVRYVVKRTGSKAIIWNAIEMHKCNISVDILAKYKYTDAGEVLPA